MGNLSHWLTPGNEALAAGVVVALAHALQTWCPPNTIAYKVAGKVLAIGPNIFDLFGVHPNPPGGLK